MQKKEREATSRPLPEKIHTSVGAEIHDEERGRIHLCHGYDLYNDLLERYSWSELTYLHLRGELPEKAESEVFDLILRSVINPGPTDWATQAAMTAAVTHTPVGNSLLTGLAVLQGRYQGALAVEKSMQMLGELAEIQEDLNETSTDTILVEYPDLPGFESHESSNKERTRKIVNRISEISVRDVYMQIALKTARLKDVHLSRQGIFSAALCDLGFSPRQGHGLYLIAAAPGILAHLLEQMEGNWASYPFGTPLEYCEPKARELSADQHCYKRENE